MLMLLVRIAHYHVRRLAVSGVLWRPRADDGNSRADCTQLSNTVAARTKSTEKDMYVSALGLHIYDNVTPK